MQGAGRARRLFNYLTERLQILDWRLKGHNHIHSIRQESQRHTGSSTSQCLRHP